ncbi:MAG: hypothetical protein WA731_01740 [Pseudonocardiaceae bacterium]|jgi:hypothetical protein|nr:hypothetical protein [Pseudonocardiaceae bacterium]
MRLQPTAVKILVAPAGAGVADQMPGDGRRGEQVGFGFHARHQLPLGDEKTVPFQFSTHLIFYRLSQHFGSRVDRLFPVVQATAGLVLRTDRFFGAGVARNPALHDRGCSRGLNPPVSRSDLAM